jgi:hypothetical protein
VEDDMPVKMLEGVKFRLGMRVRVWAAGRDGEFTIPPTNGTVCRLLMRDASAWVELDQRLEGDDAQAHLFPADDETRGRNVLTWPELCSLVMGES